VGDFSITFTCLYFKIKFPTSGFIFKNDISADKTAFHRNVNKKKNWPIWMIFQELVAEESPITNYLPG